MTLCASLGLITVTCSCMVNTAYWTHPCMNKLCVLVPVNREFFPSFFSMPYAQAHYPFENKKEFEVSFPADFIAEGIDQTRGW